MRAAEICLIAVFVTGCGGEPAGPGATAGDSSAGESGDGSTDGSTDAYEHWDGDALLDAGADGELDGSEDGSADAAVPPLSTSWSVLGWRDEESGVVEVWTLDGTAVMGKTVIATSLEQRFRVKGLADLDRDGDFDVVFRDLKDGSVLYWLMTPGGQVASSGTMEGAAGLPLTLDLASVADVDGDGYPDLVFRDHDPDHAGGISYWSYQGPLVCTGIGEVTASLDLKWRLAAAADVDGDGTEDLWFHNRVTGETGLWLMADGKLESAIASQPAAPSLYHLMAAQRDAASGTTQLFWRDFSNGDLGAWVVSPSDPSAPAQAYVASAIPFQRVGQTGEEDFKFVRTEARYVKMPPVPRVSYSLQVPNTYDPAERGALALNALTQTLLPSSDYDLYWLVDLTQKPPVMEDSDFPRINSKFLEAIALMRKMTGSDLGMDADEAMVNQISHSIGPEGLIYFPMREKPFLLIPEYKHVPFIVDLLPQARNVSALINYTKLYGTPLLPGVEERIAAGVTSISIDHGDYFEIGRPYDIVYENQQFMPRPPLLGAAYALPYDAAESGGRLIQGFAHLMAATGSAAGGQLARKYAYAMKDHVGLFQPDGAFFDPANLPPDSHIKHFAIHSKMLDAMLDYALAAGDGEMELFVLDSFSWAMNHPLSNALIGYFPEYLAEDSKHAETCELADMIAMGIKLSVRGWDYWDWVDRWIRNHFAEGQLTSALGIDELATVPDPRYTVNGSECTVTDTTGGLRACSVDNVVARNIGAWASYATGHEFVEPGYPGIMHCCTGNGARTLYLVWEHMMDYDAADARLDVRLLFNRSSAEFDLYSYLPYRGRFEVQVKPSTPATTVRVRMPDWVDPAQGQVQITDATGTPLGFEWQERFVVVQGLVAPGGRVVITFPVTDWTATVQTAGHSYLYQFRGHNAVRVLSVDGQPYDAGAVPMPIYASYQFDGDGNLQEPNPLLVTVTRHIVPDP